MINNIFKTANSLKKRTKMSPLIVNNQPFVSNEKRANILADQFAQEKAFDRVWQAGLIYCSESA